jgi:hypothetical protein
MFERFRRSREDRVEDEERGRGVGTRPRDRDVVVDRDRRTATTAETIREARVRQRAEFGGLNWGAAFFGWLVAIGLAVILTALVSAAGAALALTEVSETEATAEADTISVVGGILLVVILMLAYFAGGYVAGRMSRFDGARQGFGVWLLALLVTIVLAVVGAVADSEYNVLERFDLPRIPVDEGDLTTGGGIALAAIVVGTLLAAMVGGKIGERYHRRVDRAAVP